jgi:hypothetical protein
VWQRLVRTGTQAWQVEYRQILHIDTVSQAA